ncbi:MAG: DUF4007 family protein, partial [Leptospira sp.]|nr:DUF4007 family protein [Leptospira sp.]
QHLKKYFRNTEVAIPPIVLTYLLWLFINTYYHETGSVDLDMIRRIPDSPLRIYRIETDQVFAMMDELPTSISKKIRISRTAGMKTIQMTDLKGSEILKEIYKLRMNLSLSKSG